MKNNDWHEAYFDLVNKVECECVQQGDLVPIWDQFKRMSAELAKFKALAETLAGALGAIHSEAERAEGSWLHLKRCIAAQSVEALRQYKEARDER